MRVLTVPASRTSRTAAGSLGGSPTPGARSFPPGVATGGVLAAVALVGSLVAAPLVLLGAALVLAAAAPRTLPAQAVPTALAGASAGLEALAARVSPAVVQVVGVGAPDPRRPVGAGGALGSGFVVDPTGLVVTNAHVVRGATRLAVLVAGAAFDGVGDRAAPRVRRVPAELVGADDETDVALLRLDLGAPGGDAGSPAPRPAGLPTLPFGDSDALRPGQLVLAVGSPLGLKNSVSLGVVSAVERQLDPDRPQVHVQTDAPINPGSSGGPLVDAAGRVVGLNTFILTRSGGGEGLGFAVPAGTVRRVVDQLRRAGRVRRGEIGVVAQTITPALGDGLGLPRAWGVILSDVLPETPAARAGVRIGDRVLAVDGRPIAEAWQLEAALDVRAVGESVRLDLLRRDPPVGTGAATEQRLAVTMPIAERPGAPDWMARVRDPAHSAVPALGIVGLDVREDDPALAGLLAGRRVTAGVLVAARLDGGGVPAGGPNAADAGEGMPDGAAPGVAQTGVGGRGLQRGDIISWVAGRPVATIAEVRAAVAGVLPGEPIVAHVDRRGRLRFVTAERP